MSSLPNPPTESTDRPGTCRDCGQPIEEGQEFYWHTPPRGAQHVACAKAKASESTWRHRRTIDAAFQDLRAAVRLASTVRAPDDTCADGLHCVWVALGVHERHTMDLLRDAALAEERIEAGKARKEGGAS